LSPVIRTGIQVKFGVGHLIGDAPHQRQQQQQSSITIMDLFRPFFLASQNCKRKYPCFFLSFFSSFFFHWSKGRLGRKAPLLYSLVHCVRRFCCCGLASQPLSAPSPPSGLSRSFNVRLLALLATVIVVAMVLVLLLGFRFASIRLSIQVVFADGAGERGGGGEEEEEDLIVFGCEEGEG
jgi:hypothetical protein